MYVLKHSFLEICDGDPYNYLQSKERNMSDFVKIWHCESDLFTDWIGCADVLMWSCAKTSGSPQKREEMLWYLSHTAIKYRRQNSLKVRILLSSQRVWNLCRNQDHCWVKAHCSHHERCKIKVALQVSKVSHINRRVFFSFLCLLATTADDDRHTSVSSQRFTLRSAPAEGA